MTRQFSNLEPLVRVDWFWSQWRAMQCHKPTINMREVSRIEFQKDVVRFNPAIFHRRRPLSILCLHFQFDNWLHVFNLSLDPINSSRFSGTFQDSLPFASKLDASVESNDFKLSIFEGFLGIFKRCFAIFKLVGRFGWVKRLRVVEFGRIFRDSWGFFAVFELIGQFSLVRPFQAVNFGRIFGDS